VWQTLPACPDQRTSTNLPDQCGSGDYRSLHEKSEVAALGMYHRISIARSKIELYAALGAASRIAARFDAKQPDWKWDICGDEVIFKFRDPNGPTLLRMWLAQQSLAEDTLEII
jgi:hypothetical protein